MAKKKKTGGRNPVDPRKKVVLVGFYIQQSIIDSIGGMAQVRQLAKTYIESRADADDVGRMAMHG